MSGANKLTSRNDIVHNQDLLAGLNTIRLHLEQVRAILLLIGRGDARAGKLALLPDGGKACAESEGEAGPKEETTGIEADDDVGLDREALLNLEVEGGVEGLVNGDVHKQGHDVDEINSLDGEVVEVAQSLLESYLCTGEFGGGGGGGGGLSSRGIFTLSRRRGGIGVDGVRSEGVQHWSGRVGARNSLVRSRLAFARGLHDGRGEREKRRGQKEGCGRCLYLARQQQRNFISPFGGGGVYEETRQGLGGVGDKVTRSDGRTSAFWYNTGKRWRKDLVSSSAQLCCGIG